jgi:hypothetical protein
LNACCASGARAQVDEELTSLGTVKGGFNRESFNHLDSFSTVPAQKFAAKHRTPASMRTV